MKPSSQAYNLGSAAKDGDVELLRKCIASKNVQPLDYYLTVPLSNHPMGGHFRKLNFLYVAASHNKEEFIREAIEGFPYETLQPLLLEQAKPEMCNPLHIAAELGNLAIVKLFLKVFHSSSSSSSKKPWLQKRSEDGFTPCFLALRKRYEECAIEILKMDIQRIVNITALDGHSLFYEAVLNGFSKFALEVLRSGYPFCCAGFNNYTPLHWVTNCADGEEICRELLKREPHLIEQKNVEGDTILHSWASAGKQWPFECALKCNDNIRRVVVDLICVTNRYGQNPLHYLVADCTNEEEALKIAELLINTCKSTSSIMVVRDRLPWLVKDVDGKTPLALAIAHSREKLAMHMISADNEVLLKQDDALFLAIDKGCYEVTLMILEIVGNQGWNKLLTNHQQQNQNALHVAPKCKGDIFERLLRDHPELIEGVDKNGLTMLHHWVNIGQIKALEYVLQDHKFKHKFVKQIPALNYTHKNNPLHDAAMTNNIDEATSLKIAKLLVKAYKEEFPTWHTSLLEYLPWFMRNGQGYGPLHLAILNQREAFALFILSLYEFEPIINEILDVYQPVHGTLFLAIEKNCYQVARRMLNTLDKGSWNKYLISHSDGRNILHLAPFCTDKRFGIWLVKKASDFITKPDKNGHTPLEEASKEGAEWIIDAMLENNPSVFNLVPLAWVKACENGHVSAIRAFINKYPGNFKDHCIKHQDSPLHHIQLPNLTGYREFLKIPDIKDLINIQDSRGNTPLHQAILSKNKLLTEILLNTDDIDCSIKDDEDKTPLHLLAQVCKEQPEWIHMCKRSELGIDPTHKLTYFKHKTKLLDARSTLSVVAALIVTITFAAGFTLPGGFEQSSGYAILGRKPAFIAFIISDTLAMCFSILILIWVIMSLVYESTSAILLIDGSMKLLIFALCFTVIAFITGVYIVLASKSLYAAIIVLVICSVTILLAWITLVPPSSVLRKCSIPRFCNMKRQDPV